MRALRGDKATETTHGALLFHTRPSFEHIEETVMKIQQKLPWVYNEKLRAFNMLVGKERAIHLDKNHKCANP